MSITDYHAKYYAHELTKRCPSDSVEKLAATLLDAQVDLNPHQIDAALFAFKSPLSKGAILADEVGLGKTIEAGIVLSQKWAERKRNILIICPSAIRKQWNQELQDKFYLPSTILESKYFNEQKKLGNINSFNQSNSILICSYQFCCSKASLVRAVNWDLVVIDEAHRLRNVYKTDNKIARTLRDALIDSKKLLLTATPLQNTLLELYGLVSFIDEHTFGDLKSFKSQYSRVDDEDQYQELRSRLAPICKRTLRRQVLQYIKYTNRIAIREEFIPSADEQRLYDQVSTYLQRDKLHALPNSQRQLITLVLRKLLASSSFAIAGTLESVITRLNSAVAHKEKLIQVEEVFENDLESISGLVEEWEGEGEQEDFSPTSVEIQAIKDEIVELESFRKLAVSIVHNAKGQKLLEALAVGFKKMQELGAQPKALIFTESRRTQDYLVKLLATTPYKDKLVLFNGTNSDSKSIAIYNEWFQRHKNTDRISDSKSADIRAAVVDYFKNEAMIMIATEAAAEGVNLQFCSLVVNYDLPWNPQRIEQRIGRCHRYGQDYDVVVINFVNKNNAADQRVYQLLEEKFRLFSGVFGASDEVLGAYDSGVDFEKKILKIYQDCRSPDQIAVAFDALQNELEEEISEEVRRTKQHILEELDEEVQEKLKVQLRSSEEYLSKYENWLWKVASHTLPGFADIEPEKHRFFLRQNPYPKEEVPLGEYRLGKPIENSHNFRITHQLAQNMLKVCKSTPTVPAEIVFDYSHHPTKISVLESLRGGEGYLTLHHLSLNSLESDDYLIFSGVTKDGEVLDDDTCHRLMSIDGRLLQQRELNAPKDLLSSLYEKKKLAVLEDRELKNGSLFEEEMEKLDRWADDRKMSLKVTLNELDDEIKELRKRIRLAMTLPEKVQLRKKVQSLEKKRDDAWREYDSSKREIDDSKDDLIDRIEKKMELTITEELLFQIIWKVT